MKQLFALVALSLLVMIAFKLGEVPVEQEYRAPPLLRIEAPRKHPVAVGYPSTSSTIFATSSTISTNAACPTAGNFCAVGVR